jgi:hypothetical protein
MARVNINLSRFTPSAIYDGKGRYDAVGFVLLAAGLEPREIPEFTEHLNDESIRRVRKVFPGITVHDLERLEIASTEIGRERVSSIRRAGEKCGIDFRFTTSSKQRCLPASARR